MTEESSGPQWYAIRCIFGSGSDAAFTYEERLTLWQTDDFDEAIALAESEALQYAAANEMEYLDLAQACLLGGPPINGAEVFSLVRDSDLAADDYLDHFFDTGTERQSPWKE